MDRRDLRAQAAASHHAIQRAWRLPTNTNKLTVQPVVVQVEAPQGQQVAQLARNVACSTSSPRQHARTHDEMGHDRCSAASLSALTRLPTAKPAS